jgi:hypothetical protein
MECSEKNLTLAETARMDHPTSKARFKGAASQGKSTELNG